jgi:phage shock protein B
MNMTAIAIVAIVCWAIVELVNGPRGKKLNKKDEQKNTDLQQQIVTLKERIETLERIVTDEKYDLNRQFNDLKKDRVA